MESELDPKNTDNENIPIDPNQILVAEYEYISHAAIQANEDRARVTNFYLVTVGSVIAAMLSSRIETLDPTFYFGFAGFFSMLSLGSILTLMQLVRLRLAWIDSASAMNQIKDFYISSTPSLSGVFRWKTINIPSRFRPGSVSHLLAIQVAILGAITVGAGTYFIGLGFRLEFFIPSILASAVFLIFLVLLYKKKLA